MDFRHIYINIFINIFLKIIFVKNILSRSWILAESKSRIKEIISKIGETNFYILNLLFIKRTWILFFFQIHVLVQIIWFCILIYYKILWFILNSIWVIIQLLFNLKLRRNWLIWNKFILFLIIDFRIIKAFYTDSTKPIASIKSYFSYLLPALNHTSVKSTVLFDLCHHFLYF